VIPKGQYSDHAGKDTDGGPQWVASIVNAIGASPCQDSGLTYWKDTAIIITWDDWGGWYDHEPPTLNTALGYQLGFRVPLLVVSAYGVKNSGNQCNPYIDNDILDFGSIDNFIEGNFLGTSREGLLNFADARALQRAGHQDLFNFFDLTRQACTFQPVATQPPYNADYFINDQSTVLPPDDE
jgi:phospholipase C